MTKSGNRDARVRRHGKLLGRGPTALPRDVYDLAVAVKRTPDDAKAAIERTPLPVLATCLSRWEEGRSPKGSR